MKQREVCSKKGVRKQVEDMKLILKLGKNKNYEIRKRSSLVVRASDCQCTSCNCPGFDPSIRRHSRIWGAADEAVLNTAHRRRKKNPIKSPWLRIIRCGKRQQWWHTRMFRYLADDNYDARGLQPMTMMTREDVKVLQPMTMMTRDDV